MQKTIAICSCMDVTENFRSLSPLQGHQNSLYSQTRLCASCSEIHSSACSCRTKGERWAEMRPLSEAARLLANLLPWPFPWHMPHIRAGLEHWEASPKEEPGEAAAEKARGRKSYCLVLRKHLIYLVVTLIFIMK